MTKLLEEKELAEIRSDHERDVERAKTGKWGLTPAAQDIGKLLSHVDALDNTIAEVGQMYRDQFKDRLRAEKERDSLSQRLAADEAECAEQARLNGIGSEREARLMARLAAAESRVAELENAQLRAVGQMQVDLHEIVKLRGSLQLAERNAARYEWLRDHWDEPEVAKLHPWDEFSPDPDQLDAQIDAALSSQEQKCETCYGSKRIPDNNGYGLESLPCPACCSPSATEK